MRGRCYEQLDQGLYSQNIPRSPEGLTNHGGAIPDDELWVKLGGDKGRGSFTFNFQVVNIPHPNSVKKTVLTSVFKAGDSSSNLHTALDRYREHIEEAQGMQLKYVRSGIKYTS